MVRRVVPRTAVALSLLGLLMAVFLPWPWTALTGESARCGDLFHRRGGFPPPSNSNLGCDILHRFAWDVAWVAAGVLVVASLAMFWQGRKRNR